MATKVSVLKYGDSDEVDACAEARVMVLANFGRHAKSRWRHLASDGRVMEVDVDELNEFRTTDFHALLFRNEKPLRPNSPAKKYTARKMATYIPEPHLLPPLEAAGSPRKRLIGMDSHKIKKALQPDIEGLLQRRYARYTWLVPIVGRPPCKEPITSGLLVDPERWPDVSPAVSAATKTNGTPLLISWDPMDLFIFWLWLRDTRTNSVAGSIALSYTHLRVQDANATAFPTLSTEHSISKTVWYIAIYHDSILSLRLRRYISQFNPETMVRKGLREESKVTLADGFPDRKPQNRTVLKGARLLLTDEMGKGLLIA